MENKQIIPMLKRWTKIILGKSAAAVQQGIGRCYAKNEIRGYYHDLTNKGRSAPLLDSNKNPFFCSLSIISAEPPTSVAITGIPKLLASIKLTGSPSE